MQSEGVNWTDIGDVIAGGGDDDGKYTETEMQEVAQAARAEGVEAGIKMGMARASNGSGNGTSRCRSLRKWRNTATTGSVD